MLNEGTPSPIGSVVIVGAGLGGWRTATELRSLGFTGSVTVIGSEPVLPYDRPPLSKSWLDADHGDAPTLAGVAEASSAGIDLVLGRVVSTIGVGEVHLDDGEIERADAVVVATGCRARWPRHLPTGMVHTLRSQQDALELRAALGRSHELLVLGGGFVGAEVATTARARGIEVVVVEAQSELFESVLGAEVGQSLRARHEANGVSVHVGRSVVALGRTDRLSVLLDDGQLLTADEGLAGFGAVPNVEALRGLQPDLDDGLVCDDSGRVAGVERIWAVGDVAAWWDGMLGRPARREHWSTARHHAAVVARDLVVGPVAEPAVEVPYFWSDQAGTKLQVVGWPQLADDRGWLPGQGLESTEYGYFRSGRLVGAATIGAPRALAKHRATVTQTASTTELMRGHAR